MHFALPPRKTSQPPPYAKAAARSSSNLRRRRIQLLGYVVLGVLSLYLLLSYLYSSQSEELHNADIERDSEVVLVTTIDEGLMSKSQIRMIKTNRDDYARRHGYKTFYTNTTTYARVLGDSPSSWAMVPALRHAIKEHPRAIFFWSLTDNALIMNPSLSLSDHILQPLSSLMLKDIPVVPPDSVIHTFSHLKPANVHLILSQDMNNLAHTSLILRNEPATKGRTDNWAFYFLDAWFDPQYRAYLFEKAENHALEHIVQWHPTILAKLVLIEQRKFNSYNFAYPDIRNEDSEATRRHDSMWQDGDLVINFKGCTDDKERDCEKEMKQYYAEWEKEVEKLDGKKPPRHADIDAEKVVIAKPLPPPPPPAVPKKEKTKEDTKPEAQKKKPDEAAKEEKVMEGIKV